MYKHNYIKQTREAKGITTVKMAQLLNMDCGNYCRLEQGKYKNIPGTVLPILCATLEIDLYYLLDITPGATAEGGNN